VFAGLFNLLAHLQTFSWRLQVAGSRCCTLACCKYHLSHFICQSHSKMCSDGSASVTTTHPAAGKPSSRHQPRSSAYDAPVTSSALMLSAGSCAAPDFLGGMAATLWPRSRKAGCGLQLRGAAACPINDETTCTTTGGRIKALDQEQMQVWCAVEPMIEPMIETGKRSCVICQLQLSLGC
jgi:hypothetical protein